MRNKKIHVVALFASHTKNISLSLADYLFYISHDNTGKFSAVREITPSHLAFSR